MLTADSIILESPVGAITLWILPSDQHSDHFGHSGMLITFSLQMKHTTVVLRSELCGCALQAVAVSGAGEEAAGVADSGAVTVVAAAVEVEAAGVVAVVAAGAISTRSKSMFLGALGRRPLLTEH